MTAQEFVSKVAEAGEPTNGYGTHADALEDACWFVAYRRAQEIREAWTNKDYAHTIVQGEPLDGPYKTLADIERWLKEELEDEDEATWVEWIDAELKDWFGQSTQGGGE